MCHVFSEKENRQKYLAFSSVKSDNRVFIFCWQCKSSLDPWETLSKAESAAAHVFVMSVMSVSDGEVGIYKAICK